MRKLEKGIYVSILVEVMVGDKDGNLDYNRLLGPLSPQAAESLDELMCDMMAYIAAKEDAEEEGREPLDITKRSHAAGVWSGLKNDEFSDEISRYGGCTVEALYNDVACLQDAEIFYIDGEGRIFKCDSIREAISAYYSEEKANAETNSAQENTERIGIDIALSYGGEANKGSNGYIIYTVTCNGAANLIKLLRIMIDSNQMCPRDRDEYMEKLLTEFECGVSRLDLESDGNSVLLFLKDCTKPNGDGGGMYEVPLSKEEKAALLSLTNEWRDAINAEAGSTWTTYGFFKTNNG